MTLAKSCAAWKNRISQLRVPCVCVRVRGNNFLERAMGKQNRREKITRRTYLILEPNGDEPIKGLAALCQLELLAGT